MPTYYLLDDAVQKQHPSAKYSICILMTLGGGGMSSTMIIARSFLDLDTLLIE